MKRSVPNAALLATVLSSAWLRGAAAKEKAAAASCPSEQPPYSSEPSPFGWPLTPTDWSYSFPDCWSKKDGGYALCDGVRQSPMDLAMAKDVVEGSDGKGALKAAARYENVFSKTLTVKMSSYLRSAMVEADFGSLTLRVGGKKVVYDAVQVHLTAASLHTVNGKHYDGEIMIFHKPRGAANMIEDAVVVSAFVKKEATKTSPLFTQFGFKESDVLPSDSEPYWPATSGLSLYSEVAGALAGNALFYNGSVPVPPCSETVKWFVLEDPVPAGPKQIKSLHEMLLMWGKEKASMWRDENKRPPRPRNRPVFVNSLDVGGPHQDVTCKALGSSDQLRVAECWKYGNPTCSAENQSPVALQAKSAIPPPSQGERLRASELVRYQVPPAKSVISVAPEAYSLKVTGDGFGHVELHGRHFPLRSIAVKAIASHVFTEASGAQARYVGELVLEHSMYGDQVVDKEEYPSYNPKEHSVMISVPIKLGSPSELLRQMGVGVSAFRMTVKDGMSYSPLEDIDLMAGLQAPLLGDWYWYNGSSLEPDCDQPVKWIVLRTPIEANIDQLNFLTLPVPGLASTRMITTRTGVDPNEYMNHMPPHAVQLDHKCPDPSVPFNYLNTHCWHTCAVGCHPLCVEGTQQSPIDIDTTKVSVVKSDNFLSICRWKPVSRVHVVNNGHSFVVANQQMGYIDMIGSDGFMAYYQVAQIKLHMPSEHTINGKQYHGELHIVHANQITVEELDYNDLIIVAIPLEIGDYENPLINQLLFPAGKAAGTLKQQEHLVSEYPIDLMRALGPVIDGPFYSYTGSLTAPPCSEGVKWMVFETPQSMSAEQWVYFKTYFANPANNRPLQEPNGRMLAKNSMQVPGEKAELIQWDFFGGRHYGHDARDPGESWIVLPVIVTFLFCAVAFFAATPSEDPKRRLEAAGGLAEMIGRSSYAPIKA